MPRQASVAISDTASSRVSVPRWAIRHRALLLASGLTGLFESSARWRIAHRGTLSRDEAVSLMSTLAWRGISRFPRRDDVEAD